MSVTLPVPTPLNDSSQPNNNNNNSNNNNMLLIYKQTMKYIISLCSMLIVKLSTVLPLTLKILIANTSVLNVLVVNAPFPRILSVELTLCFINLTFYWFIWGFGVLGDRKSVV